MAFLFFFIFLTAPAAILPREIRAKSASGQSKPADSEPGTTVTVPFWAVVGSSIYAAGSPDCFRSSARALPARSVPDSTTQARPCLSRAERSSCKSCTPPPQAGNCRTAMFTRVLVGIS